jgi:hypothetical protein
MKYIRINTVVSVLGFIVFDASHDHALGYPYILMATSLIINAGKPWLRKVYNSTNITYAYQLIQEQMSRRQSLTKGASTPCAL